MNVSEDMSEGSLCSLVSYELRMKKVRLKLKGSNDAPCATGAISVSTSLLLDFALIQSLPCSCF